MKLSDKVQLTPLGDIDVSKVHGHTTILLKNVKTGEVERFEDDNMMTNAIQSYFTNCGFLNYPNLDKNTLVETLLGGVLLFDDEITESATQVRVPSGVKMVANCCVGQNSALEPTEMGIYSEEESGWQNDGSYQQTYDWTTSRGNGTIACVCLTGKAHGYVGEGNSTSNVRTSSRQNDFGLTGSVTTQSGILGDIFHIDLTDSSCYAFDLTDAATNGYGVLRKYRLPISKLRLDATMSAPVVLSETQVQLDEYFIGVLTTNDYSIRVEPNDGKLVLWNIHNVISVSTQPDWGTTWTQYVWELTHTGTITRTTLQNNSGLSLKGLQAAHFDGNYIFFVDAFGSNLYRSQVDTTTIYIYNRTSNAITAVTNPNGYAAAASYYSGMWQGRLASAGWTLRSKSGDGRIITSGDFPVVVDGAGTVFANNADTDGTQFFPVSGLISQSGANLYRDQAYIATINNLETPIVKTAEKTMKVVYKITFDEEENNNE